MITISGLLSYIAPAHGLEIGLGEVGSQLVAEGGIADEAEEGLG